MLFILPIQCANSLQPEDETKPRAMYKEVKSLNHFSLYGFTLFFAFVSKQQIYVISTQQNDFQHQHKQRWSKALFESFLVFTRKLLQHKQPLHENPTNTGKSWRHWWFLRFPCRWMNCKKFVVDFSVFVCSPQPPTPIAFLTKKSRSSVSSRTLLSADVTSHRCKKLFCVFLLLDQSSFVIERIFFLSCHRRVKISEINFNIHKSLKLNKTKKRLLWTPRGDTWRFGFHCPHD